MKSKTGILTIRRKIMFAIFLISLFSTLAFSFHAYQLQRKEILDGHVQQLRAAALAVPHMLPEGFHDRPLTPDAISEEDYLRLMWEMTDWAREAGVSFVYSFVRQDGEVLFSSTSGTAEQREKGTWVPFLEPYEASEELAAIFDTLQPQVAEEVDEFGHFLSVVLPMRNAHGEVYLVGADIYIDKIKAQLRETVLRCVLIGLILFAVMAAVGHFLSGRIARPIGALAAQTERISETGFVPDEDYEHIVGRIAASSTDEVGHLADANIQMVRKLRDYIDNIKKFTAARERIESELNIARGIQMSFLPKPMEEGETRGFDLSAVLNPAREVGGDLYEFFLLDENHLFVGIGDVSGKGVPSALMMAVTKTLFKGMAHPNLSPSAIMARVNDELREQNEEMMFVTMFCGILDLASGEFAYSNAGHNPPVLRRAGGEPEFLDVPPGIILGVGECAYQTRTVRLGEGDLLFLYTDGVTEAMNPSLELYGDERLLADLREVADGDRATSVVDKVVRRVEDYAEGEPPADDLTILALIRRRG